MRDQELFKFILHIIRVVVEDNIKSVPPFHKIWNLDIEGLDLKPSVSSNKETDKDIFYIKPSSITEMQLSKKNTAIQLQRFPRQSNLFEGQSSRSKWKTEIKSLMAKNSSSERIYIGDKVQNGTNGEFGTVVQFFPQYRNNHLLIGDLRTKNKTEEILKEIENSTETSTMTGIKKKILAEEMNKAAHWDPHRHT
ncbi:unnamed protein product [Mytilus coruscus]|uniref:Uncharacterized protein n=1 Tax=Mytilus coruscus TaxID=42192 RepID=A0A6J8AQB6_MYTCO|nr:unnamed protein product [Mytilus coruscus]